MISNKIAVGPKLFNKLGLCLFFIQVILPLSTFADDFESKYIRPSNYIVSDAPQIVNLSSQLVAGITSDEEKARQIFNWVATNIKYEYAVYNSIVKNDPTLAEGSSLAKAGDPLITLQRRLGVCSGISSLLVSMYRSVGIPARQIIGYTDDEDKVNSLLNSKSTFNSNHYWVEIYISKRWIILEPTFAVNNFEYGADHLIYFNIDKILFEKTHIKIAEIPF